MELSTIALSLHAIISAVTGLLLIMKRKHPVTTVAWLLSIIFLPLLGIALYAIFGRERIGGQARRKLRSNRRFRSQLTSEQEPHQCGLAHQDRQLLPRSVQDVINVSRKYGDFDAVGGNEVFFLNDPAETYAAMEEAIKGARNHVHLEYYIFRADRIGRRFCNLMMQKAREGVRVRLLFDAVGSWRLSFNRKLRRQLAEAGVDVQAFLPLRIFMRPWNLNMRNHRKLLIVDGETAFAGSLNVGAAFARGRGRAKAKWREFSLRIRGPALNQLQWIFCEDWFFAAGEALLADAYFPASPQCGKARLQTIASGPDIRLKAVHKAFLTAVTQARHTVYLATPYFIPDASLLLALQLAAGRGCDVRLLVPRHTDHRMVAWAGRSYFETLLESNVRVFEYQAGNYHAKLLIVDGAFVSIGSTNLDIRSFDYNFETNVHLYNRYLAKKLQEIFFIDLADSREIDAGQFGRRPAWYQFWENVCRLFSPLF